MAVDLSKLATLKEKMRTAKELNDVWEYFLDHFGENHEFIGLGEPYLSEHLTQMIGLIAGQILKTDQMVLTEMRLIGLPEYHFAHGGFLLNGIPSNVLYFDDIDLGVFFMPLGDPPICQYARFSTKTPTQRAEPSVN